MKPRNRKQALVSLLRGCLLGVACLLVGHGVSANELHPDFPLLDAAGEPVMHSGRPLSGMQTCGGCHDTGFIAESSDHAAAGVFGDGEIDCLLCHSDAGNRREWDTWLFQEDGSLAEGILNIRKPTNENCANCHGLISNDLETPLTVPAEPGHRGMTDRTGQIMSPQKVSNSGLNVAGKQSLNHAFDVHSERVLGCVNCHYSLNNPVFFEQRPESRPVHLEFDPRRLTHSEYLTRPLHQLAKGSTKHGLNAFESQNSMRRCESCHDATEVHDWLPYKAGHFAALACEACHVPRLYGPALQALDWTLVDGDGQPLRHYRDVEGDPSTADSLIRGFRPLMLERENVGGEPRLAPFNLVSSWFWQTGEPARRLTAEEVAAAFYPSGGLHPDLVAALDRDADGRVSAQELRLESDGSVAAARGLLEAAGFSEVRMASELIPYPVSHNVVNGQWATRDCRHCHSADSVMATAFALADYLPGGLMPVPEPGAEASLAGRFAATAGGGASFLPGRSGDGYYIIGLDSVAWVDLAGLLMFAGISLGVTIHAVGRYVANRRRPRVSHPTRRLHMYDAYDRIWHWLQASAILLLLFTGLVIHKPHYFGMFSFAYVVEVHNVLGFILLINAALALFYTLASGTIRRFFPEPDNFFGRAIAQAAYYSRGIFAGEGHPLQKTKQQRLNPLQQITYLAILNVLLPAQVVTGMLIWGMQTWPQLAGALGGLPVLAPLHTFLAWAFAAFIVMHVYLTTTGESPLAGIKSMVTGWEDVEVHAGDSAHRPAAAGRATDKRNISEETVNV
jgi:thiosulfate reductase cytochrome b subunit